MHACLLGWLLGWLLGCIRASVASRKMERQRLYLLISIDFHKRRIAEIQEKESEAA
jgi:hypothetical protein